MLRWSQDDTNKCYKPSFSSTSFFVLMHVDLMDLTSHLFRPAFAKTLDTRRFEPVLLGNPQSSWPLLLSSHYRLVVKGKIRGSFTTDPGNLIVTFDIRISNKSEQHDKRLCISATGALRLGSPGVGHHHECTQRKCIASGTRRLEATKRPGKTSEPWKKTLVIKGKKRGWNPTQLNGGYDKPLSESLLANQDFMESRRCFFCLWLIWKHINTQGKTGVNRHWEGDSIDRLTGGHVFFSEFDFKLGSCNLCACVLAVEGCYQYTSNGVVSVRMNQDQAAKELLVEQFGSDEFDRKSWDGLPDSELLIWNSCDTVDGSEIR